MSASAPAWLCWDGVAVVIKCGVAGWAALAADGCLHGVACLIKLEVAACRQQQQQGQAHQGRGEQVRQ